MTKEDVSKVEVDSATNKKTQKSRQIGDDVTDHLSPLKEEPKNSPPKGRVKLMGKSRERAEAARAQKNAPDQSANNLRNQAKNKQQAEDFLKQLEKTAREARYSPKAPVIKEALDQAKLQESGAKQPGDESAQVSEDKTTVAQAFGEIVWLMSQNSAVRYLFVGDLEWLVMAPLLLNQFRIFREQGRPVAVALWAWVDEERETRFKSGVKRLRPEEWRCGDRYMLVEFIK